MTSPYPEVGGRAMVKLVSGSLYDARWDGLRWWINVPNDDNDLPVEKAYVTGWDVVPLGKSVSWIKRFFAAIRRLTN